MEEWERLTSEDQLSIGEDYFIAEKDDPHVYFATYDGNDIVCDAFNLPGEHIVHGEYYFILVVWPKHPGRIEP